MPGHLIGFFEVIDGESKMISQKPKGEPNLQFKSHPPHSVVHPRIFSQFRNTHTRYNIDSDNVFRRTFNFFVVE